MQNSLSDLAALNIKPIRVYAVAPQIMVMGAIDPLWKLILPLILQHCNEFLIETLGGVKVFQRSKAYLESLVVDNDVL